jgi:diacylglycerol kinase (ATP)
MNIVTKIKMRNRLLSYIAVLPFVLLGDITTVENHRVDESSPQEFTSSATSAERSDEKAECSSQVHIFMNTGSGGRKAGTLLRAGIRALALDIGEKKVELSIWDLGKGGPGNLPGLKVVLNRLELDNCDYKNDPIRIIAAGGDGSVIWVMSEVISHGIDTTRVVFGTIPYGTGNDFSHAFGWGAKPPKHLLSSNLEGLRQLIREWMGASVSPHDLWEISVFVNLKRGRILQRRGNRTHAIKHTIPFKKKMGNYFSIGAESQVGFSFDKRRTKSRRLNKGVYAWAGLKRLLRRNQSLAKDISACYDGESLLFSGTKDSQAAPPHLIGDPITLLLLNINSFSAGLNPWLASRKSGLSATPAVNNDQEMGDGKIEILTYLTMAGLAGEQLGDKLFGGNAHRIGQSRGPLSILFHKSSEPIRKLYMQIDGEYYAVEGLEKVEIRHDVTVNVLKKEKR